MNRGFDFGKMLNLFKDSLIDSVGVLVGGGAVSVTEFALAVSIDNPDKRGVEALL